MRDRILINTDMIPYIFKIRLPQKEYTLNIGYNTKNDFYTVGLSLDGVVLSYGEPIVYGVPLFEDIRKVPSFPMITIVPFDESGQADNVTADNFGKTVFLIVDNEEESIIE